MEGYGWWLILVGVAIALALVWLFAGRLPRDEDDVSSGERTAEAAWISRTIERHGGVAPAALVEEVLELHHAYLADPRLARAPVVAQAPSLPTGYPTGSVAYPPGGTPPPPVGPRRGVPLPPGGLPAPPVRDPRQPPPAGPPAR